VQGQTKAVSFDGREIKLTTGRFAPQAGGSVMIECGDTSVLVTATKSTGREGVDFLPLMCDYEERLYAAGRIPGSFMRREGRPPERATLISRLIDRPMRPLFPGWMRDDIQIVATCLSLDERVPADVLAVTGASMATLLAGIPFQGPMAAVRVGLLGDDFVLNPSYREIERGDLDLVVAGTPDGVVMVEAGANQLSEQDVIEAIDFGYEAITELINAQKEVLKESGIKQEIHEAPQIDDTISNYLDKNCTKSISEVLKKFDQTKEERDNKIEEIKINISSKIDGGWLQWKIKPIKEGFFKSISGWLMIMPLVLLIGWFMNEIIGDQGGSNPLLELVLNSDEFIPLLFLLITTVILAPVFEELVFRGVLLPVLVSKVGKISGVLLSALIFALAHLSVGELPPLFVLGIGLGLMRLSSGRLFPCALMHSLWNGVTFISLLLVA